MFGSDKALLEDTGVARREADTNGEKVIPTAPVVMDLISQWAARKHRAPVPLVVIHSHAHGDHIAGDAQFQALPNVQVIAPTPAAIQQATGISTWPAGIGQLDLGGRIVDVIPFPGHNEASIALYDRLTGILLTGDSLYPGLLSVNQAELAIFADSTCGWPCLSASIRWRTCSARTSPRSAAPHVDYVRGTGGSPARRERSRAEARAHVCAEMRAPAGLKGTLTTVATPEFTIVPSAARPRPPAPAK
jgi:glyoxylase-like metal-dependent hydrolase (beta-lactamase superfamily II)